MGIKSKISPELKIKAVEDYLEGNKSSIQIRDEMHISNEAFHEWVRKYRKSGIEGFKIRTKGKVYSLELKGKAVLEYLNGLGSLNDICNKYDISTHSLLLKWIKKYNGHVNCKSHNSEGGKLMTIGRKTTFEERVDIVAFCISNNDNYQMASHRYKVSYQQIYTWVQKYKEHGYEALVDNRGKRKNPQEMNETEKLTAQLKLLEAQKKQLQMENDFLKKLNEVERRGYQKDIRK